MRIIVWMNQPSHYQTAFFRELASRPGISVSVVYARGVPMERRALGWKEAEDEVFAQRYLNRTGGLLSVARTAWRERRSIHVVNGVWSVPVFILASWLLWFFRAPLFFHSEAPNPSLERRGVMGWCKWTVGRCMVNRSRGIFVIGQKAGRYYRALGVRAEKIFKFAYFVSPGPVKKVLPRDRNFHIFFVGQFVERKGVLPLIAAAAALRSAGIPAVLNLIGGGPLAQRYRAEAARAGISEFVVDEGPAQAGEISARLALADVVVLPSHFDGWGLTINEALHAGKPVVVTEDCGVEELVRHQPEWGIVVQRSDAGLLAEAMAEIYQNKDQYIVHPPAVDAVIGCVAMTDYFLDAVLWSKNRVGPRPAPKWSAAAGESETRESCEPCPDIGGVRANS